MLGLGGYLLAATASSKQGLSVCSVGSEQHGCRCPLPLLDEAGAAEAQRRAVIKGKTPQHDANIQRAACQLPRLGVPGLTCHRACGTVSQNQGRPKACRFSI